LLYIHAVSTLYNSFSLHDALPICHRSILEILGSNILVRLQGSCSFSTYASTPIASARSIKRNISSSWEPYLSSNATVSVCSSLRSEEHTSELQSRFDLVCRLLLDI